MSDLDDHQSRTINVVLVEDHPVVRLGVIEQLSAAGMNVVAAATTVEEGRRLVIDNAPDVAVIDQRLPDGTGIDLCRSLTLEAPDVVTVIYSSFLTSLDLKEARAAGAADAVAKSINGYALLAAIRRHVRPG